MEQIHQLQEMIKNHHYDLFASLKHNPLYEVIKTLSDSITEKSPDFQRPEIYSIILLEIVAKLEPDKQQEWIPLAVCFSKIYIVFYTSFFLADMANSPLAPLGRLFGTDKIYLALITLITHVSQEMIEWGQQYLQSQQPNESSPKPPKQSGDTVLLDDQIITDCLKKSMDYMLIQEDSRKMLTQDIIKQEDIQVLFDAKRREFLQAVIFSPFYLVWRKHPPSQRDSAERFSKLFSQSYYQCMELGSESKMPKGQFVEVCQQIYRFHRILTQDLQIQSQVLNYFKQQMIEKLHSVEVEDN